MSHQPKVFVLVLAGQERDALAFAKRHYPACERVILSKTDLRAAATQAWTQFCAGGVTLGPPTPAYSSLTSVRIK